MLVMLVLFTFTLPLLVLAYVQDSGLAVVLTVLTVSTYWTVNEVARDVEDAFIMEPNSERGRGGGTGRTADVVQQQECPCTTSMRGQAMP